MTEGLYARPGQAGWDSQVMDFATVVRRMKVELLMLPSALLGPALPAFGPALMLLSVLPSCLTMSALWSVCVSSWPCSHAPG